MHNIKITITGDKKTIKYLTNVEKQIEKPQKPLQQSSKIMMAAIMQNFKTEGLTFGEPWKELELVTYKIKEFLYRVKGWDPIHPLVRSRQMINSFESKIFGKTLVIYNPISYFKKHQSSSPADRVIRPLTRTSGGWELSSKRFLLPRRVMMKIDKERIKLIIGAFTDWISIIIKKSVK